MESNHSAKTTRGGVSFSPSVVPEPPVLSPCQHINGKGHRCRMFTSDPNSTLCAHHVRKQIKTRRLQNEATANELLGNIEDFSTADSVNIFLGNLVKQLAHKRIARRDAVALAYISQLLLNSLSALSRERRPENVHDPDDDPTDAVLSLFRSRDRDDDPNETPNHQYENQSANSGHNANNEERPQA
jgi:hypothetical protein